MPKRMDDKKAERLGRRGFISKGSGLAVGAMMMDGLWANAQEIKPAVKKPASGKAAPPPPPAVNCAVIGLGEQGRDIIKALAALPGAEIKLVCDTYEGIHKRALDMAHKGAAIKEYRKILDDKSIQAVFVATPTHQHKDIVLAALQAGKHVYCEAPIAHTVDDARIITQAALKASKQVFIPGLNRRLNHLEKHVYGFARTGVPGRLATGRATWSKKTSWRRAGAGPERESSLNWRLDKKVSTGLVGELGIHQIDLASWFMRSKPVSVLGMGAVMNWKDREIPDTVQCIYEYANGFRFLYSATLANSFEAACEVFQGSDAALMMRNDRAWLFKESDAPNLGWEVYATKENIGSETGIALVANATKLLDEGLDPSENRNAYAKGPLYYSAETFFNAIRGTEKSTLGAVEGFEATVVALKSNEAVMSGSKIVFKKEWFAL